jgi:hypothetical protein
VCTRIEADQTELYDFVFDQTSHLLARTIFHIEDTGHALVTNYSNYMDVRGIKFAQNSISKFDDGTPWKSSNLSFQIDVDYKKDLFDKPPSLKDGPSGWQERR